MNALSFRYVTNHNLWFYAKQVKLAELGFGKRKCDCEPDILLGHIFLEAGEGRLVMGALKDTGP